MRHRFLEAKAGHFRAGLRGWRRRAPAAPPSRGILPLRHLDPAWMQARLLMRYDFRTVARRPEDRQAVARGAARKRWGGDHGPDHVRCRSCRDAGVARQPGGRCRGRGPGPGRLFARRAGGMGAALRHARPLFAEYALHQYDPAGAPGTAPGRARDRASDPLLHPLERARDHPPCQQGEFRTRRPYCELPVDGYALRHRCDALLACRDR